MDNFNLRKYFAEGGIHNRLIEARISIDMLKDQFVDTGRIRQDAFDKIVDAVNNNAGYATWLTSKVAGSKNKKPLIKKEDIYKYKDYLDIFDRNKSKYPIKDINAIKTQSELNDFIKKSVDIKNIETKDISKQTGVPKALKYKDLKMGEVDGYEIYKLPKDSNDLYGAACDLGSGTEWCTATGKTDGQFLNYIQYGPLYIIINKNNPKEKYQFSYEANQFMDAEDNNIFVNF